MTQLNLKIVQNLKSIQQLCRVQDLKKQFDFFFMNLVIVRFFNTAKS